MLEICTHCNSHEQLQQLHHLLWGCPEERGRGSYSAKKLLLWFWITDMYLQAIKTSRLLFYIPVPICVTWKVLIVHHRARRLATVARWRRSRSAPGRVASVRGFRGERGQAGSLLRLQAALVRERERRDLDHCFWALLGAHETAANHRHPCCFDATSEGVSWWVYGSARPDLSAHAQYVWRRYSEIILHYAGQIYTYKNPRFFYKKTNKLTAMNNYIKMITCVNTERRKERERETEIERK